MKYNKIENKLKFDYNNMMASYIGENGFTEKDLAEMNAPAKAAFNFVSENRGKGWMGWTELPYNQKEIVEDILATAKDVRKNFDNFVVLGIGGSALTAKTLGEGDIPRARRYFTMMGTQFMLWIRLVIQRILMKAGLKIYL